MREIKISQETASRWYNGTDSELKALAIQTYPELAVKELPKTWEELGHINGYLIDLYSVISSNAGSSTERNRNFFATKEQAEASIAMAQLSQLMAKYNDGWAADWSDGTDKYSIYFECENLVLDRMTHYRSFITFKNKETAELFLENFKDLIQTAKPLL